uniref:Uncharacterized protein n=1 Tax=Arundo donax TaxID=35708 RepID=A0A0A8ZZN3_ARUDO
MISTVVMMSLPGESSISNNLTAIL